MRRPFSTSRKQPGLPPGSLVFSGERRQERVRLTVMCYDEGAYSEAEIESVEACRELKAKSRTTWLNVDGLHDASLLGAVGELFGIHPLALEDILHTEQRPKVEFYDDFVFCVLKMLGGESRDGTIGSEQVSIVVGADFVVSFQERVGDTFDPIRDRIRTGKGRLRKMGADYLAYSLIDSIVDNYFVLLEGFGERIELLDEQLVAKAGQENLRSIHALKRDLITIRRAVWPLREAIGALERSESSIIAKGTSVYLRDLYDHTIQIIDTVESYRDMSSGLVDLYMSSLSNRMNEVMKVLTIIATIFIPLTFIAGVYGMNFNPASSPFNMPELNWRWGYLVALGAMLATAVGMLVYFKRRKWL